MLLLNYIFICNQGISSRIRADLWSITVFTALTSPPHQYTCNKTSRHPPYSRLPAKKSRNKFNSGNSPCNLQIVTSSFPFATIPSHSVSPILTAAPRLALALRVRVRGRLDTLFSVSKTLQSLQIRLCRTSQGHSAHGPRIPSELPSASRNSWNARSRDV
jgi:hypothetical protein